MIDGFLTFRAEITIRHEWCCENSELRIQKSGNRRKALEPVRGKRVDCTRLEVRVED